MRTIKRILAVSGLTGMIAALAFASTASAGAGGIDRFKGACITTGTAKYNPPIQFISGSGNYTFSDTLLSCVGIEQAKGGVLQAVDVVTFDISSVGSYTNVVCGTGKALGSLKVDSPPTVTAIVGTTKVDTQVEWQTIADDLDYAIEFVSFNGLLKWLSDPAQKVGVEVPKLLTSGPTGFPGGYVLIFPDQTKVSPLPNACAKAAYFHAAMVVDWSNTNPIEII